MFSSPEDDGGRLVSRGWLGQVQSQEASFHVSCLSLGSQDEVVSNMAYQISCVLAKDRDDSIAAIPSHYHIYNAGGMVLHHHYVGGWLDIAEEVGEAGPKVYGAYYRGAILLINLDGVTAYLHCPTSGDVLVKHSISSDVGCAHGQDQDHRRHTP